MKNFLLVLLFIGSVSKLEAKDRFYAFLNKKYLSNPTECLKKSKQVMHFFPKVASSYYFASKIANDKINTSKTSYQKYRNLLLSIGYAEKFLKLADSSLLENWSWNELALSIESNFDLTNKLLVQDRNQKLSQALNQKLPNFFLKSQNDLSTNSSEPNVSTEKPTNILPTDELSESKASIHADALYGMPSGKENFPSNNLANEKMLLHLINQERLKKHLDTLTWNEDLARACRYHATDLATQNYFEHDSYDRINGKMVKEGGTFDRIRAFYSKTHVNSENIAAGSSFPSGTYQQWYTSPGHYKNMFNSSSKKVGIGVVYVPNSDYGYYWVFCTAE